MKIGNATNRPELAWARGYLQVAGVALPSCPPCSRLQLHPFCQLQLQPGGEAPSCPRKHRWISGCFGAVDSFRLWCNRDSLCACFASLPCPAEIVTRGRAHQVQHRQAVSRKVKPPSASPQSYQRPLVWPLTWVWNNFHCRGEILKSLFSPCFSCPWWEESLLPAMTATSHHQELGTGEQEGNEENKTFTRLKSVWNTSS